MLGLGFPLGLEINGSPVSPQFQKLFRAEGLLTFMSESQKKKLRTGGTAGGAQRKRGADRDVDVPTLGQVAEEPRFAPLHELLEPVKDTPLNELGKNTEAALRKACEADAGLALLLESFFDACDARAEEVARKRAHMASEEHSPGKQQRWLFFPPLSLSLSPLCAFARSLWAPRHAMSVKGPVACVARGPMT